MKGSLLSAEIVEPYAEALMSVAQSKDMAERFGEDVRALLALLEESSELQEFVSNPIIGETQKKAVLEQIIGDGNPYLTNFLRLLVDRRRVVFLEQVCQQYLALLRKLNNTVLAEVTSATALSESQQQAVADKVKAMTNAQAVELNTTIDPELMGGVIVKVGSQVLDASLKGQLRRIGMRLSAST